MAMFYERMMNEEVTPRMVGLADAQIIALAKETIDATREETRRSIDDDGVVRDLQQPGVTIDLGHKSISRLPDEAIDVMQDEIERLAISHNLLSSLPMRLADCRRLRYLNVRYNAIREFPQPVLQLVSLEILDVSKNKIKSIPDEIANLTSLKVLAIQKNRIERLPVCLGDISSLHVLKLDGNPLEFPPQDICTLHKDIAIPTNDNERDAAITTQIKRYLRQIVTRERLKMESEGELSTSEGNVETPRPPKRVVSGRFPVKPSVGSVEASETARPESPCQAPPLPSRSHYRVHSSQHNNMRRPNVSPLVVSNERNRSQSEGSTSATMRQKRGGLVISNVSELESVEEVKARKLGNINVISQGAPLSDGNNQRSIASTNRPLSDLLEHKRRSRAPDVAVEASKNILFAMSQLQDPALNLTRCIKNESSKDSKKRDDQSVNFNVASADIRDLRQLLRKFDTLAEEDEEDAHRLSFYIRRMTMKALHSFIDVISMLVRGAKQIAREGDKRILRTILLLHQGSIIEIRNACSMMGLEFFTSRKTRPQILGQEIGLSDKYASNSVRIASAQNPYGRSQFSSESTFKPMLELPEPSGLDHQISMGTTTPRSGVSFNTLTSVFMSQSDIASGEEETKFERIYLKLRSACSSVESMSFIRDSFVQAKSAARRDLSASDPRIQILRNLVHKTGEFLSLTHALSEILHEIKLKDSLARDDVAFWQHCYAYSKVWFEFVAMISGEATRMRLVQEDVKVAMRSIHRAVKEVTSLIHVSPWGHLARERAAPTPVTPAMSTTDPKANSKAHANVTSNAIPINPAKYAAGNPATSSAIGYVTPVPATPLSAALGAAAQAAIPKTSDNLQLHGASISNSATHATLNSIPSAAFAGNIFERAERLLQSAQRRV